MCQLDWLCMKLQENDRQNDADLNYKICSGNCA